MDVASNGLIEDSRRHLVQGGQIAIENDFVAANQEDGLLDAFCWDEVMAGLFELEWRLAAAPWIAVFTPDGNKMIPGKENADLLGDLLHAHIAPKSMQAVKRARKNYKDLRGVQYPISEEELGKRLPSVEVTFVPERVEYRPELSEQVEAELAAIRPEEIE